MPLRRIAPIAIATAFKKGKHDSQVRAKDAAGNADPTPASQSWTVKKKK